MTSAEREAPEPAGRLSAFLGYGFYLLSIPSLAVFALVGVVFAYAGRGGADPLARSHLDAQIRLFWWAFWWAVFLAIAGVISAVLTIVLIGFPLLWLVGVIGFIVMCWFTVKSALGLLRLLDNRPAAAR